MFKSNKQKILFGLIFLHLVAALPLAFILNIWADEGATLYTTQHGFFNALQNVFTDEKQAPLYFLIMSLWRKLNDSIFFARLFSIICSLLAIKSFAVLAHKIRAEKYALLATGFFALHPVLFWASLEIRLYSLIVLITALLLNFFYDGYLDDEIVSRNGKKASRNAQIFYVLTAIFAIYTNYYLGSFLVGGFAALIILRRWQAAKIYFLQMFAVGLAILPVLWIISQQFNVIEGEFQADKSIVEGLKILWNHFLTFVLPTELYPPENVSAISTFRLWLIRIAILLVLFFAIKLKGKIINDKVIAFGTILLFEAAFLLFVYFQLGTSVVQMRHATIFFAPLIFFCFSILIPLLPRKAFVFLVCLCLIFFSYSLFTQYSNLTKRGDWARIGAFIEQNEKPNQPIIIFQTYDAVVLPYHYSGNNRILPDEKYFSFGLEAKAGSPDSLRRQIEFVISEIPPEADEIWLLTNEQCTEKDGCQPLENFVQANYTIVQEKVFYLERVRLLRKK